MMSPLYKTGDVVQYTERPRKWEPRVMIVLEVLDILENTVRYSVLIGDEKHDDVYEHWVEFVK